MNKQQKIVEMAKDICRVKHITRKRGCAKRTETGSSNG